AEPRHIYYVLERAGQILGGGGIGPLSGTVEPDICEIRKMYFRPELRGLGQGERLLKLLLEDARTLGYKTAYLETLKSMTRARKLYQRLGFVPLPSPLGNTGHGGCDQWYARRVDSK
ncbi:MAG: GNAT family N-acetyltransferase, partial [Bdellovibrionota bacterium]